VEHAHAGTRAAVGELGRGEIILQANAELGVTADQHTWNTLMRARAQLSESSVEVRSSCKPMQNSCAN
jgi:hypothetical protein